LIRNPGNNDSPLKLFSVHHNPPCGGCAHDHHDDAEARKDNAKRGFGQQNAAKETLGVV